LIFPLIPKATVLILGPLKEAERSSQLPKRVKGDALILNAMEKMVGKLISKKTLNMSI